MKIKERKKQKGITLIALVITIIVLLILAGVSIATLTGQNGILTQANNAKEQTEKAGEKEAISLAYSAAKAKKLENQDTSAVTAADMNEQFGLNGTNNATATGNTILTVKFTDSQREYYVMTDGEVVDELESQEGIFTYTEDGYITGVKDEYLKDPEIGSGIKYASKDEIKIASMINTYYLIDELNGTLIIPNKIGDTKIIGIDTAAFSAIVNLEQVVILDGITIIKPEAFSYCKKLKNINLPSTLLQIEDYAFNACDRLTNITIPLSVTRIGTNAFLNCKDLKTITIEGKEGSISGKPWGAPYTTEIIYLNEDIPSTFVEEYFSDKQEGDLEELILKSEMYIGSFENYLSENDLNRAALNEMAEDKGMTYEEFLKDSILSHPNSWLRIEYGAYVLGIIDKKPEELKKIYMEKNELEGDFDSYIESNLPEGMTWEQLYQQQGMRTEEDALKVLIVGNIEL